MQSRCNGISTRIRKRDASQTLAITKPLPIDYQTITKWWNDVPVFLGRFFYIYLCPVKPLSADGAGAGRQRVQPYSYTKTYENGK